MSTLGYQALSVSLALSLYAAIVYAWTSFRPAAAHLHSAYRATFASFVLTTISCISLLFALLSRDFQIEYVAHYTNRSLSLAYTLAAFWAGQDGSLLLWTWLLTLFSFIVLRTNKERHPDRKSVV